MPSEVLGFFMRRAALLFLPVVITLMVLVAAAAWAFYRPLRVIAPEWVGVECLNGNVCTDDNARLIEATRLYAEARDFVQAKAGMIRSEPRIVFCATPECSRSFGFTNQLAYSVGTMGIVVSHRDWRPSLVRYELIRHLQNERLGSLRMALFKPRWFREGMAASISDDQHRPLPEPLNSYRAKFEEWFGKIDKKALWVEAARL